MTSEKFNWPKCLCQIWESSTATKIQTHLSWGKCVLKKKGSAVSLKKYIRWIWPVLNFKLVFWSINKTERFFSRTLSIEINLNLYCSTYSTSSNRSLTFCIVHWKLQSASYLLPSIAVSFHWDWTTSFLYQKSTSKFFSKHNVISATCIDDNFYFIYFKFFKISTNWCWRLICSHN